MENLSAHCSQPLPKFICQLLLAYTQLDKEISAERLTDFAAGKIPLVHFADKGEDVSESNFEPVYGTYGETVTSPSFFMFEHILREYGGEDICFIARQMAFISKKEGHGRVLLQAIETSGIDIFKQYSVGEIGGRRRVKNSVPNIFASYDDFNIDIICLSNYRRFFSQKYDITTSGKVIETCTQNGLIRDSESFHYDVFTVFSNITKAGGAIIHRTWHAGNPMVLHDKKLHAFVGVEQVATMKSGTDWQSGTIFIYRKIDDREITAQQLHDFLRKHQPYQSHAIRQQTLNIQPLITQSYIGI